MSHFDSGSVLDFVVSNLRIGGSAGVVSRYGNNFDRRPGFELPRLDETSVKIGR